MIGRAILSGALVFGYATIALYFMRFWSDTRDRLFLFFSSSFVLLAIQRLAIATTRETMENQTIFYVMRLVAFLLIIVAIVDKNRR